MTDSANAALWIGMLVQQFPELHQELAPGRTTTSERPDAVHTPRPGQADRLRQERREALLMEQRHGLAVPGHTAAPLRLHVSDTIRDITDGVIELEEAVHAGLGLPQPRRARVPERLLRIAALLENIAAHPVLAAHVRDETRRMARRCARVLGDTESVVRVPGRCPWCDSVSLRAFPERRAVLCINPVCRCADPDCGCRDDPAYRHLWPETGWDALAEATGQALDDLRTTLDAAPRPEASAPTRAEGTRAVRSGAERTSGRQATAHAVGRASR